MSTDPSMAAEQKINETPIVDLFSNQNEIWGGFSNPINNDTRILFNKQYPLPHRIKFFLFNLYHHIHRREGALREVENDQVTVMEAVIGAALLKYHYSDDRGVYIDGDRRVVSCSVGRPERVIKFLNKLFIDKEDPDSQDKIIALSSILYYFCKYFLTEEFLSQISHYGELNPRVEFFDLVLFTLLQESTLFLFSLEPFSESRPQQEAAKTLAQRLKIKSLDAVARSAIRSDRRYEAWTLLEIQTFNRNIYESFSTDEPNAVLIQDLLTLIRFCDLRIWCLRIGTETSKKFKICLFRQAISELEQLEHQFFDPLSKLEDLQSNLEKYSFIVYMIACIKRPWSSESYPKAFFHKTDSAQAFEKWHLDLPPQSCLLRFLKEFQKISFKDRSETGQILLFGEEFQNFLERCKTGVEGVDDELSGAIQNFSTEVFKKIGFNSLGSRSLRVFQPAHLGNEGPSGLHEARP